MCLYYLCLDDGEGPGSKPPATPRGCRQIMPRETVPLFVLVLACAYLNETG